MASPNKTNASPVALVAGLVLIVVGVWNLVNAIVPQSLWSIAVSGLRVLWGFIWPCALVAAGAYVLWASKTGKLAGFMSGTGRGPFRRSRTDKRLFGVCGGIAYYFGVDSTVVRIFAVMLLLIIPPTAVIAYFATALLVPHE